MTKAAINKQWRHPALDLEFSLSADIFPDLAEWFLEHHVFQRWCRKHIEWQLHCVGGPGSGKSVIAALVAQHLRHRFRNENFPIISVFVNRDVNAHENEFFEDFLDVVYKALERGRHHRHDLSAAYYEEYSIARTDEAGGSRVSHRISTLRKAMYTRLRWVSQHQRTFLVFDGIDCFSPMLRLMIETELSELQSHGVNVMVTSRIAVFEQVMTQCDHDRHGETEENEPIPLEYRDLLVMFSTCKTCGQILCFDCHEAGRVCGKCHSNMAMHEEYKHVNIKISTPYKAMENYIAWDLEREHGELGLGSSAAKPESSSLGLEMLREGPTAVKDIAKDIQELAAGHVGLAKARLDLVHDAHSLAELRQKRYQLPANILAIFDAGMQGLEARGDAQKDIGLAAIAAIAYEHGEMSVPATQNLVHGLVSPATRSGEDIVEAARGFIFATPGGDPQLLRIFHETFLRYVRDRYNDKLFHTLQTLKKVYGIDDDDVQDTAEMSQTYVRFEPAMTSEQPAEVTAYKVDRTATTPSGTEHAPRVPYIIRAGTRMWQ